MNFTHRFSIEVASLLLMGSCSSSQIPPPSPGSNQPQAPTTVSKEDVARALAIAAEYKSYGRVDDELRWAPFLCRQPAPGVARQSASTDQGTHGQKLYSVFAKDHKSYPADSQVGQVIVKESFKAEPVTDPSAVHAPVWTDFNVDDDHFYPYAQKDGKIYRVGDAAGLFVMYRVDANVANSDEGWIYATVSADKQVTASGRISSCMTCHQDAKYGRLFGVPTSPDDR